jgi:xylose dehydrogenase (NAD/NADP)
MADKIRWGVLGTARHAGNTLLPAFYAAKSGDVVAVASRDSARARQFANAHGIPASYGDYEALLADETIDAVYIPLPNHLHKEWAIRAAEAGKHCLCEKPLGLNAAEAEQMIQAFKAAGLTLAEAFQWRHHPQAQRVRQMLRDGAIGELRMINAGFTFMLNRPGDIRARPETGGGALYDVGCYPVSLARYMTGQEPLTATAQAHWSKSGVDDRLAATLEFPGGVLATIYCGLTLPLRRYYEVMGSEGTLAVNYAYNPLGDRRGEVLHYQDDWKLHNTIRLDAVNSYELLVEDFNRALLDQRPPLFPGNDALGNMRAIDAIYQAARQGGTVTVAQGK